MMIICVYETQNVYLSFSSIGPNVITQNIGFIIQQNFEEGTVFHHVARQVKGWMNRSMIQLP